MNLSFQQNELNNQAIKRIKKALEVAGGFIEYATIEEEEPLTDEQKDAMFSIYYDSQYADNSEGWIVSISAGKHDCTLSVTDEDGILENIDLLTLSFDEICSIADFLTPKEKPVFNVENVLRVIDITSIQFEERFLNWLYEEIKPTWRDTVLKEHLYNIEGIVDDAEVLEGYPSWVIKTLLDLKTVLEVNNASYIRITY